jgi:DME family drug/metabolite transporter
MNQPQADGSSSVRSIGGQWLVLAAAILWGTTGTAQVFAPEGATPLSVGAVRLVFGGLTLLVWAIARGSFQNGIHLPFKPTLVAAGGIAVYQVCFFAGVARTGVAVGTIVGIGTAPVWSGALDWLIVGQRPGRRWLLATGLAIIGSTLLIAGGSSISVDPSGVLLAMGAGLAYAVYTLASKQLLAGRSPDLVMAVVFVIGALILLPIFLGSDLSWLAEPGGMAVAFHLGVITVGIAYALFARGLTAIAASSAVTLTLAEPLTAAMLGLVVLGERLAPVALIGIAFLFAGLATLSIGRPAAERGEKTS